VKARRNLGLVPAAAAAILVASCGSGGPTSSADNGESSKAASQILQDVASAYRSAKSVHLAGSVNSSGQTYTVDMKIVAGGTVSGNIAFQGVTADVVIVGGKTYIKGKSLFAQFAGPAAAATIGDNWVAVPASAAAEITGGFATLTDFNQLADQLKTPSGTVTKGASTTILGQPVITLRDDKATLYVAASGKPYPVQFKPINDATQHLDFTEYDQNFNIAAPSGAIDYSGVGAGTGASSPTP
jgi:hypothetical protein